MANIEDVARLAGVGKATVSRVLSGNGYVKAATKEKIESAIKELNYTPNEIARNLYYQKSGIVAIIVPRLAHPFFAEFLNEAEIALCSKGYQMMICNTLSDENYELKYLDMLKRRVVDGIICGSYSLNTEQAYRSVHRPIVGLDRDLGEDIPCISVNHREGGRLAAWELINAGCKCVLQVCGSETSEKSDFKSPSNERHDVFYQIMKDNGIQCYNYFTKWNNVSYEYMYDISRDIFKKYPDVEGIFATDIVILNIAKYAFETGKEVPKDLKLVSYDGTNIVDFAYPSVTTVCQPIDELAKRTVELIVDLINGVKPENNKIELNVTLRKGLSTGR